MNRSRRHSVPYAVGALLAVAVGLLAGCASQRPVPEPPPSEPAKALFRAAKACHRREDYRAAIEKLQAAIADSPRYVMAHRLYQDTSFCIRRIAPLVRQYEALRDRHRHDPLYRYLYGRLQITARGQEREFRKARNADRRFAWAWNGLATVAHQRRKLWDAERYYKKAIGLSGGRIVAPMIGLGKLYGLKGRYDKAHKVLRQVTDVDPTDPVPHVVVAVIHRDRRKYSSALMACERAIGIQSTYRPALRMYRRLAPRHAGAADLVRGRKCLRSARAQSPDDPEVLGTLALVEMLLGEEQAALMDFEKARAGGLCPVDYAGAVRLLHVRKGDYARGLAIWHEKVPEQLIEAPGNVAADRYRDLTRATARVDRSPRDTGELLALARAYLRVGWIKEAVAVVGRVREQAPALEAAAELHDELTRHMDLCDQIEQIFRRDYVRFQTRRRYRSLEEVLREVEQIAAIRTGRDFARKTKCVEYPFMGRITEHVHPPRSDLMRYFDRFGQMLIMGKPCGRAPVECVLMTVVSRQPDRQTKLWGVAVPNERVLAEDLKVTGYRDTLQHRRTGGQTFADFFYTNIDAVWEWCSSDVRLFRELWRPDAPPPAADLPPLLIDRMSAESTRLLNLAYSREAGEDRARYFLLALNLVDCHEMGHVADAHTHLPLGKFLLRDVLLGVRCGFSFLRVLAYTERNAELTALVHAESPRLVLGATTRFLETGFDRSPHALGYRRIIERLVEEIERHPEAYPEIDTTTRIVDQLTELPPEKIRSLGRALGEKWHIPQRVRELSK